MSIDAQQNSSKKLNPESALEWLARSTGASIAYSGSVPIDTGDSGSEENIPKTLSYTNGYAETDPDSKNSYVNLTPSIDGPSPFVYFMDGSRMAWKIAELSYGGKIWPIIAGQIGVACYKRINRQIVADQSSRIYKTILSIPQEICGVSANESQNKKRIEDCRKGLNERLGWSGRNPIDAILTYADKDNDKTNLAVSRIQALMVATEKRMIFELAEAGKLSDSEYLIKDGSSYL